MTMLWLAAIGLLVAGMVGVIPWVLDWPLFAAAAIAAAIAAVLTVRKVRRVNVAIGTAALIGKEAIVRTALSPNGYVFIQGERWAARIETGAAAVGDHVKIVGAEGFSLRVEKVS